MSDLSQPRLTLLPLPAAVYAWPTPGLPGYPEPAPPRKPLACQVEGTNGKTTVGLLKALDPTHGTIALHVAGARMPITLRFSQFRRLRLMEPLVPLGDGEPDEPALAHEPVPFVMELVDGPRWEGVTLGHLEEPWGVFLFEPIDATGTLRRTFAPRSAWQRLEIGRRIGELLVEQHAATPEQVQAALDEQRALRERKLGDLLLVRQIITPEELHTAIDEQSRMPMVRIGEALMALGFIGEAQLQEALDQQKQDRGIPLGELLVRNGAVSRGDLQVALSRKMGYPMVDVTQFPAESDAVARLPGAVAERVPALPLMMRAGRLVVALEDPSNRPSIEEIEFAARAKVVPVLARSVDLMKAIGSAYAKIGMQLSGTIGDGTVDFEPGDVTKLAATLDSGEGGDDDGPIIEQSDNSLVRLINSMILEAHAQGVSDIHVECPGGREKVRVRFRKDGVLRPYLELPPGYRNAMVARIKIMCDLDISERRKPQDGKINFGKFVQGSRLELRVATLPTNSGHEDAVLRLLTAHRAMPLDSLQLAPRVLDRFKVAVQRPYGMILVVGPTGSGKTTTLHSALNLINTPERKIWTAEDPVEITQPGLRQVQVNPRIDLSFARMLRAFLRADPDVIMVGEIRDQETAAVSIEASLTGHLVLSTLHTNSAAETVTRLLDMGMDPFNFGDALIVVLAQRLVRRLCVNCRVGEPASEAEQAELLADYLHVMHGVPGVPTGDEVLADWMRRFGNNGRLTRFRSVGCEECSGTGLRGRVGIHELLGNSRPMRQRIQTGARAEELLQLALAEGMRTLRQDGIEKVLAGLTSIEEVRSSAN